MTVYASEPAPRLDVFLRDETEFTRSKIKNLIDSGAVTVNGESVKAGSKIKAGDTVSIEYTERVTELKPEPIDIDVVYEDDALAVINKGRNMVVHPGAGNESGTLVNALLYRFSTLSGLGSWAGIVHRLDKDTTGLMVVAKTDRAHACLSKQIADRTVTKIYRAVLDGSPKNDEGTIETLIARDRRNRLKMAVSDDGREAITQYKVLRRYAHNSYVQFKLLTGRTHQIRVHAKYIGCPVTCDPLYGNKSRFTVDGQLLHSYRLEFDHPTTGERMTFEKKEPDDFMAVLDTLEREMA